MHHASTYMYFKYSVRNYALHRWFACELSSLFGVFVSYCCYLSHNNIFTCTVWFAVAHIKEKISKVISALHNQFLEQFQWFCINNWFIISKDIGLISLHSIQVTEKHWGINWRCRAQVLALFSLDHWCDLAMQTSIKIMLFHAEMGMLSACFPLASHCM